MTRPLLVVLAALLVLVQGVPVADQAYSLEAAVRREFPSYDWQLRDQIQRGMNAREADRLWRETPAASATLRRLVDANRMDDAIVSLEAATHGSLNDLLASFDTFSEKLTYITQDQSRGYSERISAIVTSLRTRVAALPREDAARLAWRLMELDQRLGNRGSRGWDESLRAFAGEYQGTAQALRAEIYAIDYGTNLVDRIAAWDAIVRAHPGSEAAAMALYLKGFRVAAETVSGQNLDYTDIFLQTVAIVDELESGRYPECEWVRKAPDLIVGFFWSDESRNRMPPSNRARVLAEYQRFARKHFTPEAVSEFGYSLAYLLSSRMPGFFDPERERIAGVEALLTDLEAGGADKRAIELFRAEFLIRTALGGSEPWREAPLSKAETALTSIAAADAGFYSRKAAAVNASRLMYQRDYTRALAAYETYASRYPSSPFAWVARVRAGQCLMELGDLSRAAAMFESVTTLGAQEPLATLLGSALAAQTFDALGQYDRSLIAYRRAVAAWSDEYGQDLTPTPSRVRRPGPATGDSAARLAVTRQNLSDRVASLERNLKTTVGPLLELAGSQIDARRFSDARATLTKAMAQARTDDDRAAARTLNHRARLEIAMETIAIEGTAADSAAGLKLFETISREPFDANVGFAGIARATVLFRNGANEQARLAMTSALDAWRENQRVLRNAKPVSPMEADVRDIRSLIFRPAGTFDLLARASWNAYTPSTVPYAVINPHVRVELADGTKTRITVHQDFPERLKAVFWTTDEIALAARLIVTLGGTQRRTPTGVMETPNQPAGAAVDVMKFWSAFFPTRGGHWGGWVVETYPIISRIRFADAARTKAAVDIVVGYSGATVVMEKTNGVWVALRLVNQWIT